MTEDMAIWINLAMLAGGGLAAWAAKDAAWKGAVAVLAGSLASVVLARYLPSASLLVMNVAAIVIVGLVGAALRMRPVAIVATIAGACAAGILFAMVFIVDWQNLPTR